jgi:hypothetical protein
VGCSPSGVGILASGCAIRIRVISRKLSIGVWSMVAAFGLTTTYAIVYALFPVPYLLRAYPHAQGVVWTFIGAVLSFGVWMIAASEKRQRTVALFVRWLGLVPLITTLMFHVANVLSYVGGPSSLDVADQLIRHGFAMLLVWVFLFPIILFAHLRLLARRLLSSQLMEHSVIVGVGTPLTAAGVSLGVLLLKYGRFIGLPEPHPNAQWPTVLLATLMSLAGLFAIWIMYLLIRFAIAFMIEARALRKLWREADRSGLTSPSG